MLGKFFTKKETENLEGKIRDIQNGDEELRNKVIEEYQDFVLKSVRDVLDKKIDFSSDEFSIGLIAFDEAIQSYKFNNSFQSFAKLVIKRRLIDYWRKEQRQSESEGLVQSEQNLSYNKYIIEGQVEDRREEVITFSKELNHFGISFTELSKQVPKHIDAKRNLLNVAQLLAQDEELNKKLHETQKLPLKSLLEKVEVSKKTLERNRNFIIAMSLIWSGNYNHLKEFLKT